MKEEFYIRSFLVIEIKKTRRLASHVLGRRQRRRCTYTLFLKFLTTSNGLPARNLYFIPKIPRYVEFTSSWEFILSYSVKKEE